MPALPLELYTAAQLRALDRLAIEVAHIPALTLMNRAGAAALRTLRVAWPTAQRIAVVCGGGNNGGDGYVLARLARSAGLDAGVATTGDPARLRGEARSAFEECRTAGVSIAPFGAQSLGGADLIVDAVFGIGLDRPLDAANCRIVGEINSARVPVLALDLPSGLNADSGAVMGAAVHATRTITFIGLKLGCFQGAGPDLAGVLEFDPLDTPSPPAGLIAPVAARIDPALIQRVLPRRRRTAHKGDFGHVLIVGGGSGMAGAARLCGEACLRSGAGLVTVATRAAHALAISAERPELMCHGVEEGRALRGLIERATVIAIGPGLGRDEWARMMLEAVLESDRPLIVDADALNLLAEKPLRRDNWILTPHPGEAARLLGLETRVVQDDRPAALARLIERYGGVVVLKGAGTLVGSAEQIPALCDRGNPGMATAGMGDVLTGVIAAVRAQTRDPWDAARVGVMAHALAGDTAAQGGERGVIASDVIARLPACLNPHRSS
ncbi:MAG TPA: NAD(P)H-hydrate dehydratase [Steroidobacteraceae bacterium]|nr:NAD(P)H-hydrate dehydratase [Steroidobacteraceae bacterium]